MGCSDEIMAKKKERAFFICPDWAKLTADIPRPLHIHPKHAAAIAAGQPVPRSTLQHALVEVSHASGKILDIAALMLDRRLDERLKAR
jgi:hypothetical protein